MSDVRMCLSCGRTRPAAEGREAPGEGCSSSDACTWDLTPEEAWQFWRQKYHELRETRPVRVKPLEWGKTCYGTPEAKTVFGWYRINESMAGGWSVVIGRDVLTSEEGRVNFPTIKAAKAAAQADYERRIKAMFEWTVEPDPCLTEAQKLLSWAADSFAQHAKSSRVPDEIEGYTETSEMYRKAALQLAVYLFSSHEGRREERNAPA